MALQNGQHRGDRQGQDGTNCCWCLQCRCNHLPTCPYVEAAALYTAPKKGFTLLLAFQQGMSEEQLPASPHCPTAREDTNASAYPQYWVEPRFTRAAKVRVIITAVFFLLAAGSNAAVLGSLLRKRRKSHVQPLILSLALADLLVTVMVMPLDAAWNVTVQWYGGDISCKVLNFLKLFAMYAAALVLVVISLDRHAAILHPFSRAHRRNGMLLRAAWAGSVLLALPQVRLSALPVELVQAGVVLEKGSSIPTSPASPSLSMDSASTRPSHELGAQSLSNNSREVLSTHSQQHLQDVVLCSKSSLSYSLVLHFSSSSST